MSSYILLRLATLSCDFQKTVDEIYIIWHRKQAFYRSLVPCLSVRMVERGSGVWRVADHNLHICWPLDLRCAWSFAWIPCKLHSFIDDRWGRVDLFNFTPPLFLFWSTIWVNSGHVTLTYDFDRGSSVHIIQHSDLPEASLMFPPVPVFVLVSIFFWTSRNLTVTTQNFSLSVRYSGLKSEGLFELRSMLYQLELLPSSRRP